LIWCCGFLIVLPLEILVTRWYWDGKSQFCKHAVPDSMTIVIVFTCGIVCVISYLIVLGRSVLGVAPGSVQKTYFRMAAMYPLNFLITYAVILYSYVSTDMYGYNPFFLAGALMEGLSGILNVVTYALQSRFRARLRDETSGARLNDNTNQHQIESSASYRVGFSHSGVMDISFLDAELSWSGNSEDAEGETERLDDRGADAIPIGNFGLEGTAKTYRTIKRATVFETPDPHSPAIAVLEVNQHVGVTSVLCDMEHQRFWGKTKDPLGWLTLRTMDDGFDWAVRTEN